MFPTSNVDIASTTSDPETRASNDIAALAAREDTRSPDQERKMDTQEAISSPKSTLAVGSASEEEETPAAASMDLSESEQVEEDAHGDESSAMKAVDEPSTPSSTQTAGAGSAENQAAAEAKGGAEEDFGEDHTETEPATLTSYHALELSVREGSKSTSRHASISEKSGSSSATATTVSTNEKTEGRARGPPKMITTRTSKSKSGSSLRRGKWTAEEETYVARVIQDFNSGFLDAPAGTTLRSYLSEKLQCDPMRITKKFTGDACIGKRVFHPAVRTPSNAASIDKAQGELVNLEQRWRRRLEMQQRESAKKAAASAVAVAANRVLSTEACSTQGNHPENAVTRTASWLDRARSVLQDPSDTAPLANESGSIQSQMREVQRLIHEGPIIQQTSADLPEMIDQAEQRAAIADAEPADKRMRTAEDAEALVGFLRSVRASAASGQTF